MLARKRVSVSLSMIVVAGWCMAAGLQVPLSKEGFESAWNKGGETKPGAVVQRYHLGSRHLATGDIDVYLSTPYARALYVSSNRKSKTRAMEMESQWAKVREASGIYVVVTTIGTPAKGFIEPTKGEPQVQRALIRNPGTGETHSPGFSGRVKKGPEHDYSQSLGMNWGWLFEFDQALFDGHESIEVIVETTSHRAVIPVDRGKFLALPENEQNATP